MKVTVNREKHSIRIEGDSTSIDLSPVDAYNLFRRLEEKKSELYDLATNYYDCRDCGQVHRKGETCPTLAQEEI